MTSKTMIESVILQNSAPLCMQYQLLFGIKKKKKKKKKKKFTLLFNATM